MISPHLFFQCKNNRYLIVVDDKNANNIHQGKLDRQKQVVTDKQRHLHIKHMMSVPDDFYIKENGYYRIAPKYLDSLIDYDLLTVDFTNYLVKGVDFKGTNAAIDPQKVYKKDLDASGVTSKTFFIM